MSDVMDRGKLLSADELEDAFVTARGDDDIADQALEEIEAHIAALNWQIEQTHNSAVQNCAVYLQGRAAHERSMANTYELGGNGVMALAHERRAKAFDDAEIALRSNCLQNAEHMKK